MNKTVKILEMGIKMEKRKQAFSKWKIPDMDGWMDGRKDGRVRVSE